MTSDRPSRDVERGSGNQRGNEARLRGSETRDDPSSKPANWGLALDLGMRLGIAVVLGLGAGLLVDSWLRTSPLFTLVGVILGVAAAMYTIWDVAREAMRR